MNAICLIQLLFWSVFAESNVECPAFCTCIDEKADCTGQNVTYIPRFPRQVSSVTMCQSKISFLGEHSLLNLTFILHLMEFNLTDNGIKQIHPNAFSNMSGLEKLIVNQERNLNSNVLMTALGKLNDPSFKTLYLSNNKWHGLPKDLFTPLATSHIENLHLTGNTINSLNCSVFSPLQYLKTLHLKWNTIETVDLVGITNLIGMFLEINNLLEFPQFCSSNGSHTPYLQHLVLWDNSIRKIDRNSLQCLESITYLNFELNFIEIIKNNTFAYLPNLKIVRMGLASCNCLHGLRTIEECAFNSSSLETLSLIDTCFDFRSLSNHVSIFANSPNLRHLDLSGNDLRSREVQLKSMLKPLQKLEMLNISSAYLLQMPLDVFTDISTLKILNLDYNEIDNWNDTEHIFGNTSLTHLSLKYNLITTMKNSSLSKNLWASLLSIDLSYNPFRCSCDNIWFSNWIKNETITLAGYPKSYICESPNHMKGVLLKDYKPTIESCSPLDPLVKIIVLVSFACVVVLAIIWICCRCQTNIKNRLYLFRVQLNRRKGYTQLENTEDFEYHAFVVYCEADSKWVHNEFLRKMEIEEGMKLCVHHRDFDVGDTITNNIDKYIQKSFKVVVVLSNAFAKSDWCQWEIDIVQERRRRQGKNAFLLIMLKSINSKHMTSSLRTLLDTTPHLTYQTGIGGKSFWKAATETLRKPLGHPPTAIL